jgi:hypothetical protein
MRIDNWKIRLTQWFLEKGLGAPDDVSLLLGNRVRKWSPYIRIETRALWAAEPLSRKIRAIARGRWQHSSDIAQKQALETYRAQIFGTDDDWGNHLLVLYDWHLKREWELESLTDADKQRAVALASFTILTRLRYRDVITSPLNLRLGLRAPDVAGLAYPMIAKVPLLSFRYFLDLDVHYTFDAIRHSRHPFADDIIAFLYELLFLQQKTAIALLEFVRLIAYADENKKTATLINAEVNAIMQADSIFAYLKASIEKTIALVGAVYGAPGLDAKKDHKARLRALRTALPRDIDKVFYANILFDIVGSENLEDLNNYRAGLLHKKGIADLQPHNYVGQTPESLPLRKIFAVMHEQHFMNTAGLVVALALLTDDLVRRDPPPFARTDIPTDLFVDAIKKRIEAAAERDASSGPVATQDAAQDKGDA